MKKSRLNHITVIIFVFSIIFHGITFYLLLIYNNVHNFPLYWYKEVAAMLITSLMISMFLFFFHHSKIMTFLLLVSRMVIILLIGYPLGDHIIVELMLLISLVLDIIFYTNTAFGIGLSLIVITTSLLVQKEGVAWGSIILKVSVENMLFLSIYPLLIMALGVVVKCYQKKVHNLTIHNDMLKKSSLKFVEVNMELQKYVIKKEGEAVLGERMKISREIHDIVGHTLMSIILMMKAALEVSGETNNQLHEYLLHSKDQAQKGLNEIRQALGEMRSSNIDQRLYLVSALNKLTNAFQGTYVDMKAFYGNVPWNFDISTNEVIYRIVQEGITNAIQHGNAHTIKIYFWCEKDTIQITIKDDGYGCDNPVHGIGLNGIKERISTFTGRLETKSFSDGFQLKVYFKFRKKN